MDVPDVEELNVVFFYVAHRKRSRFTRPARAHAIRSSARWRDLSSPSRRTRSCAPWGQNGAVSTD